MKTNILLMGDIGSGKTTSLRTLLPEYKDSAGKLCKGAGLETFLIAMEPGWEASLGNHSCAQGLHVHYIAPASVPWATVAKYVGLANTMNVDQLLKLADPNRSQYIQFAQVFGTCANFVCDSCGASFGDVSQWDDKRALALDTLTSLSSVAMNCVVGGKPIKSLPEYGTVMEFIEAFFKLFWGNTGCSAILTAHIDRETSPITGLSTITAHTIGQKLAPKLVKMPDEVIIARHERGRYVWSTIEEGTVLKHRRLPESDTIPPDFSQLFKD